jgi:hypothetical protein
MGLLPQVFERHLYAVIVEFLIVGAELVAAARATQEELTDDADGRVRLTLEQGRVADVDGAGRHNARRPIRLGVFGVHVDHPPNFPGGGGTYFPSTVVVALGEPGVPVICWAGADRAAAMIATANIAYARRYEFGFIFSSKADCCWRTKIMGSLHQLDFTRPPWV